MTDTFAQSAASWSGWVSYSATRWRILVAGTATRILTDDRLADYGPWFGNHRRLRELIAGLGALSLNIAEADPRWNR